MTQGKHTSEGDTSFRTSVLRSIGGGAALVLAVAVLFWAIGSVGRDDGGVVVADGPDTGQEQPVAPEGTGSGDDDGLDPDGQPAPEPDPDPAADPDPDPDPDADPELDPDPEPGPDPEPSPDAGAPALAPGEVTVQVLDGYKSDGGTAAAAVADDLVAGGYEVVARNPALDYDVTTVLWSPGHEQAGRQVAAAIGAAEAREQSGNLSTSVMVHVVVGADRG